MNELESWTDKKSEQQMGSYLRFRDLLEAAPDAIFEVDRDGTIVLTNAAAERMFGYEREDLLGQLIEVLVPDASRSRHRHHRDRYTEHPATRPMGIGLELFARRKDGSEFPVEISLSPIRAGETPRTIAIIRDITARREAEARINAMHEKFAAELAATNQQLEVRTREAEQANRLKSEFLASMSHELRTPLHTIIGFADLLGEELKGPLNADQKRFVGHVQRDSRHLLELINDILDLSKIEAGRLDLHPETFDSADAVNETLAAFRPQAHDKNINLVSKVGSGQITADKVRFKEILYNLVSNALKFTRAAGAITVEAAVRGDRFECSVADTGVGIPEEAQDAIFDKFYQYGSTTRGVREGTGLGLAITRSLVEMHGGSIRVFSRIGQGSRFEFWLPLNMSSLPKAGHAAAAHIHRKIMLVTNDAEHGGLLANYLSERNFRVLQASSWPDMQGSPDEPDAAVIDLVALGSEGWRIIQMLRQSHPAPSFPIVALAVTREDAAAVHIGADVILRKPVSPSLLTNTVRSYVRTLPGETGRVLIVDDEQEARELIADALRAAGLLPVLASSGKSALEALERGPVATAVVDLLMPEMSGFELIARIRRNPAWSQLPIVVLTAKDLSDGDPKVLVTQSEALLLKDSEWRPELLDRVAVLLKNAVQP